MKPLATKTILLCLLLLVLAAPFAQATPSITDNGDGTTTFFDDFSDRISGLQFGDTLGTYATAGTGGASNIDTTNEWWRTKQSATAASAPTVGWYGAYSPCEQPSDFSTSFTVDTITGPTTGGFVIGLGSNAAAMATQQGTGITVAVIFTLTATDVYSLTAVVDGSVAATQSVFGTGIAAGTDLLVEIGELDCDLAKATFVVTSPTTTYSTSVDASGVFTTSDLRGFAFIGHGTLGTAEAFIDDVTITAPPIGVPEIFWCSSSAADDFGYDFKEQVSFVENPSGSGMDNVYLWGSDTGTGDFGYLGKSIDDDLAADSATSSTAMRVYFRIEAGGGDSASNMRIAFSFVDSGETLDKGNGEDTGDLDDHVEVRFQESGDNWNVKMFYAKDATARTSFGVSTTRPNADSPHSYYFEIDTVALTARLHRWSDDVVLLENTLPAALANLQVFSQWFIGFNDVGLVAVSPATYLDSNTNDSTCLLDPNGVAFAGGDQGAFIGDDLEGDDDEGEPTDLAATGSRLGEALGLGDLGGQVLLAIMYMLIFGGFVYNEVHNSIAGFVIGAALGLVFTIFTGLMPPVVTFLLVLAGAIFVGMRLFSGGAASSDGGM